MSSFYIVLLTRPCISVPNRRNCFSCIKRHMGRSRIKRLRGTNLDIQFLVVAGKALPTRRYSLESVKSKCHRWEKHLFSAMGAFHINCAVISFTQDL